MEKSLLFSEFKKFSPELRRVTAVVFLIALIISTPLIVGNSHYLDDNQRIMTGSVDMWFKDGRPLTAWLLQSISFSTIISDLSPLPLIGGLAALAFMLILSLDKLLNAKPTLTAILALTVMLSPFIAQPMLFTFDCLPILISIGLSFLGCIDIHSTPGRQYLFSLSTFLASLCLYQTSLNHSLINILLTIMVFIPKRHDHSKVALKHILTITTSLVSAALLYQTVIGPHYITGAHNLPRTALVDVSFSSIPKIIDNAVVFLSGVMQGFPGYAVLPFILITVTGCLACWIMAWAALRMPATDSRRYLKALFYIWAPFCVVLGIPGFMVIFNAPEMRPRVLTAFSSALLFFFYAGFSIFPRLRKCLTGLIIFHLALSASFMAATFRATVNQSLFDDALATSIRNDLSRLAQSDISSISFIGDSPIAPAVKPYFKNYPFAGAMIPPALSESSIFRYQNLAYRFMIYQPLAETTASLKAYQPSVLASSNCLYRMFLYQRTAVVDFNHSPCAVPD